MYQADIRSWTLYGNTKIMGDDDLDAVEEAYKDAAKQEWSKAREAFTREFQIRQRLRLELIRRLTTMIQI